MGAIRSFIAIPVKGLPEIDRIMGEIGRIRGIKGIRPENVHLTLKFLGDVNEDGEIPRIMNILYQIAHRSAPFQIHFRGTGAFPNISRIRVAWIGIDSPTIKSLAEDIIRSLPRRFDEKKQSFKAHLTIGRVKSMKEIDRAKGLIDRYSDHEFGTLDVEEFHLIKSTLTPQGPIYDIIERFPLRGN